MKKEQSDYGNKLFYDRKASMINRLALDRERILNLQVYRKTKSVFLNLFRLVTLYTK